MPDENKLRALDSSGFVVKRTCLRCVHFQAYKPLSREWGTCQKINYEHLKHTATETPRFASVPIDGSCPNHEFGDEQRRSLGGHQRFIELKGDPIE